MADNGAASSSQTSANLSTPDYVLYHESQAAALCGVHAINTLLQGPFVDEIQCAEIAQQLDAQELALMAEAGVDSVDFLSFMGEDSANVSASGMFSIQVLSKILEMWGLTLVPLSSPEASHARKEPQAFTAYLLNLNEHWFTIRKVSGGRTSASDGDWWNFNSLFAAPEPLSPFYLAAFLSSMQDQGYTIFLVKGHLPEQDPAAAEGQRSGEGRWMTASEARAELKKKETLKQQGFLKAAASSITSMASAAGQRMRLRSVGRGAGVAAASRGGGVEDAELQMALEASRKEAYANGNDTSMTGDDFDVDEDLAAAIAASLADAADVSQPTTAGAAAGGSGGPSASLNPETGVYALGSTDLLTGNGTLDAPCPGDVSMENQELQNTAVVLELGDEPSATAAGVLEIGLKLPTGERRSRRFLREDAVGQIAAFAASCGCEMKGHRLAMTFPRKIFDNWEMKIEEAGIGNKDIVFVEPVT